MGLLKNSSMGLGLGIVGINILAEVIGDKVKNKAQEKNSVTNNHVIYHQSAPIQANYIPVSNAPIYQGSYNPRPVENYNYASRERAVYGMVNEESERLRRELEELDLELEILDEDYSDVIENVFTADELNGYAENNAPGISPSEQNSGRTTFCMMCGMKIVSPLARFCGGCGARL